MFSFQEIQRLQAATTGPRIEFNMGSIGDPSRRRVDRTTPYTRALDAPPGAATTVSSRTIRSQPVAPASTAAIPPANNPLMSAVSFWAAAPDRANLTAKWRQLDGESNASSFARLLNRLGETAEAKNADSRPLLTSRIGDVLHELGDSSELRAFCFALAEDALATCGDSVALGFEYIEDAIIDHKAERGDLLEPALLNLVKQKFRQSVVENIAMEKIASLRTVDAVEVHLAYRTQLKEILDLPGKSNDMLYFFASGVSTRDLKLAQARVQSLELGHQMQDFICEYLPWKSHLKRTHAHVFEARLASVAAEMDFFSVAPPGMTDGDYMRKCASLVSQRDAAEKDTVRELTRLHFPADSITAPPAQSKKKSRLRSFFGR
jgi:hypothetical protein